MAGPAREKSIQYFPEMCEYRRPLSSFLQTSKLSTSHAGNPDTTNDHIGHFRYFRAKGG